MTREEAIEIIQDMMNVVQTVGSAYVYKHNGGYERLRGILDILRSTPQPGKPLTLDQLREMDGQPVWCEDLEFGCSCWGYWNGDGAIGYFSNFAYDDYGTGWLAYSYPPAHIDRSEWLNFYNDFSTAECSKCGELFELSPVETPKEEFFKAFKEFYHFCPYCGALMTDEAVQMVMERLEALHGET